MAKKNKYKSLETFFHEAQIRQIQNAAAVLERWSDMQIKDIADANDR